MSNQGWVDQTKTGTWPTLIKTTRQETFDKALLNDQKDHHGTIFIGDSYLLFQDKNRQCCFGLESGMVVGYSMAKVKVGFLKSVHFYSLTISKNSTDLTKITFESEKSAKNLKVIVESNISGLNNFRSTSTNSDRAQNAAHATGVPAQSQTLSTTKGGRQIARGMAGIAQKKENIRLDDDKNIDTAFSDGLKGLELAAKEMIELSKKISKEKIGKTGALSDDENIQFRNHLMTLGMADATAMEDTASAGSAAGMSSTSHLQDNDSQQLFKKLKIKSAESGNFLLLSDVFCVVNRIKGIDLISPEDTLKFVNNLAIRNSKNCKLINYDSGAMALEFVDSGGNSINSFESYFEKCLRIEDYEYLTAELLNANFKVPILVATERLKQAQKEGYLCSDYSMQGTRYFRNLFV